MPQLTGILGLLSALTRSYNMQASPANARHAPTCRCLHFANIHHRHHAKRWQNICITSVGKRVKRNTFQSDVSHRAERQHKRFRREAAPLVRAQADNDSSFWKGCAEDLVTKHVKANSIIGLGTGVLVNAIIEVIAQKTSSGQLKGVRCIPASDVSASEAAFQGVTVTSLKEHPVVDVAFEEVNEIVLLEDGLPFIAGRLAEPVQPNLLRMRALLAASQHNVALVDGMDNTTARLRGALPVVVDADFWEDTGEALDDIFIPDAEVWRRSVGGYDPADPRAMSAPYISTQGQNILDVKFYGPLKLYGENANYAAIAKEVDSIDGVVTHGLFVDVAHSAAMFTDEGVQWFEGTVAEVQDSH